MKRSNSNSGALLLNPSDSAVNYSEGGLVSKGMDEGASSSSALPRERQNLGPVYDVLKSRMRYDLKVTDEGRNLPYLKSPGVLERMLKTVAMGVCFPYALCKTSVIDRDEVGVVKTFTGASFLKSETTYCLPPFQQEVSRVKLNQTGAYNFANLGLVKIENGTIGVIADEQTGEFYFLPPGLHAWDSPFMKFCDVQGIVPKQSTEKSNNSSRGSNVVQLGTPYQLVTVAEGDVAITYDNGQLKILGDKLDGSRVYLLHHANWTCEGILSTQQQFDQLKSTDMFTKDPIEVDLDTTVSWRIVNPELAARHAGKTMEQIKNIVHRTARATIANMISTQKISDGLVGPATFERASAPQEVDDENPPAPEFLQSASTEQIQDCNRQLKGIGVAVDGLHIVERKIKDDAARQLLAQMAAIAVETNRKAQVALAEKYTMEIHAKGEAEATRTNAAAEADRITLIAKAQQAAGQKLGTVDSTAARLAIIKQFAEMLRGTDKVFLPTDGLTSMGLFANPNVLGPSKKSQAAIESTRAPENSAGVR